MFYSVEQIFLDNIVEFGKSYLSDEYINQMYHSFGLISCAMITDKVVITILTFVGSRQMKKK